MINLTVSIISGRSEENIKRCLDTLKKAMPKNVKPTLVVTDNCSEWNVEQLAKSFFPDAEIIKNEIPKGFGANHNDALLERKDDFALIINDDIEIDPNALTNLLELAQKTEKGAAFGPILFPASWDADYISAGGRTGEKIPKPILNGISLLIRFVLGDDFIRKFLGKRNKDSKPQDEEKAYISGACCLVRRKYIESFGLYDPEYYMYFDDIDLGTRIRLNGWQCWQCGTAKVMHMEGGSFSRQTWNWIADSNLRYSKKFHGVFTRLTAGFFIGILKILLKLKR
jgi:N-acetylglucosaminyl-diphospho-decaprenol L-rhamnosyltransferase